MAEALFKGLGVAFSGAGQEMQYQQRQDAEMRRKQVLAAMRRKWQVEDREDEQEFRRGLMHEGAQLNFEYGQKQSAIDWARGAPEREALVDQRRAAAEASRARSSYLSAQEEQLGEFGGMEPTANQRDVLAMARALDVDEGTAWRIQKGLLNRGGRADAVDLAKDLFVGGYSGDTSVKHFVENHGTMAERLGITKDTTYDEALQKVTGVLEPITAGGIQLPSRGGGVIDQAGGNQPGIQTGMQTGPGDQAPQFPGVPYAYSQVAQAALEALQGGRDPRQVRARMIQNGVPEEVAQRILALASRPQ